MERVCGYRAVRGARLYGGVSAEGQHSACMHLLYEQACMQLGHAMLFWLQQTCHKSGIIMRTPLWCTVGGAKSSHMTVLAEPCVLTVSCAQTLDLQGCMQEHSDYYKDLLYEQTGEQSPEAIQDEIIEHEHAKSPGVAHTLKI